VTALGAITFCATQKMGNERNSPSAQTTFISDPFSVPHKMLRPERVKIKNNNQRQQQRQHPFAGLL
jgi:hypothetical protein